MHNNVYKPLLGHRSSGIFLRNLPMQFFTWQDSGNPTQRLIHNNVKYNSSEIVLTSLIIHGKLKFTADV